MKRILLCISIIIVFAECALSQSDSLQLDETNKFYSADNILLYVDSSSSVLISIALTLSMSIVFWSFDLLISASFVNFI